MSDDIRDERYILSLAADLEGYAGSSIATSRDMRADLLDAAKTLREGQRQAEAYRRQVVLLSKGDPNAAELVLARIIEKLDTWDEEGVYPEKIEMAIDELIAMARR